jgi:hypothetical protein
VVLRHGPYPAIRGLFGISVDALSGIVNVDPHVPAQWPSATLHNLQVGGESVDIKFLRRGETMHITLIPKQSASRIKLASSVIGARTSNTGKELLLPLPAIEIGLPYGADTALPLPGSSTGAMKVLNEESRPHQLIVTLEAQAGTTQQLFLRTNGSKLNLTVEGATIRESTLMVNFPPGNGYQQTNVTLRW